jgi:GTP cyclohydrolase I
MDPAEILSKTFDVGGRYDQMVCVGPIEVHSTCEHHLLPILGEAWVAYIPRKGGRVVGLSKLPRLVDCFALRLQVQERLTQQVADEVSRHLDPLGWGVLVRARHLCMALRGASKPDALMTTTALGGAIREDQAARSEFLACCST